MGARETARFFAIWVEAVMSSTRESAAMGPQGVPPVFVLVTSMLDQPQVALVGEMEAGRPPLEAGAIGQHLTF